jgi:hypothetical protein
MEATMGGCILAAALLVGPAALPAQAIDRFVLILEGARGSIVVQMGGGETRCAPPPPEEYPPDERPQSGGWHGGRQPRGDLRAAAWLGREAPPVGLGWGWARAGATRSAKPIREAFRGNRERRDRDGRAHGRSTHAPGRAGHPSHDRGRGTGNDSRGPGLPHRQGP